MKRDILNRAVEIIKKDQGINPRKLTNKGKTSLINALGKKYPLNELLKMMEMPKSNYSYQKEAQSLPDKYVALRTDVKKVFIGNQNCYGYRRIYIVIRNKGIIISEKVIRRITKKE